MLSPRHVSNVNRDDQGRDAAKAQRPCSSEAGQCGGRPRRRTRSRVGRGHAPHAHAGCGEGRLLQGLRSRCRPPPSSTTASHRAPSSQRGRHSASEQQAPSASAAAGAGPEATSRHLSPSAAPTCLLWAALRTLKAPPRPDPPAPSCPPSSTHPAQPQRGSTTSSIRSGRGSVTSDPRPHRGARFTSGTGEESRRPPAAPRPARGHAPRRPRPRQTALTLRRPRDGRRPGRVSAPSSLLKPTAPLASEPTPVHQALHPAPGHPDPPPALRTSAPPTGGKQAFW